MTKKRNPATPDAPKPRTWKDEVRAQNEMVARLCVERGIDQAELFLRVRERLRFCCQQIRNAATHDRRIPQSRLDMDAAGLEADSAPVAAGQEGSSPDEAQNPQIAPDQSGSAKTRKGHNGPRSPEFDRRAGQGGFRAQVRPAHARKPRKAWGGKYADLTPKEPEEGQPSARSDWPSFHQTQGE